MRNVSRFRLRAHILAVESSIWRSGNGHCDRCSYAAVQNEMRVLFQYQDLFELSEESTRSFSSLSANPFLWRPLILNLIFYHMIFYLIYDILPDI